MRPILCIVGARPNYVKMAPILRALGARGIPARLVDTGQHYDPQLSGLLLQQLSMPAADANLAVGSGSHAQQTAEVMKRFEPVLRSERPAAVLVVGDVNSTLACALVAAKELVPVIHVEAGLRSHDRTMPEEINRVLTDQLSDLLFTTERAASTNLAREGIDAHRVHFVGNVMIDSLFALRDQAVRPKAEDGDYAVLTLHRPSNVDDGQTLEQLLDAIYDISRKIRIVFPMHPRTAQRLAGLGVEQRLHGRVVLGPPVGYLEMLGLMAGARFVMTDSGGVQEETTALGVPCLTLRKNTERPVTVAEGTNTLVGTDAAAILAAAEEVLHGGGKRGRRPEFWDGRAAERVAAIIAEHFRAR